MSSRAVTVTWNVSPAVAEAGAACSWRWVAGNQGAQPVTLTTQVTPGTWRVAVEALSGASSYTLGVTYPDAPPPTVPPEVTLILKRMPTGELIGIIWGWPAVSGRCGVASCSFSETSWRAWKKR